MVLSSVLAACTIIVGGIITSSRQEKVKLSSRQDHIVQSLRMSNAADIDIVAGILSASVQEDW
eukprot:scaffold330999_cov103-Cyclotella_meneghiniana.AAC.3